jgi:hypothetical protein
MNWSIKDCAKYELGAAATQDPAQAVAEAEARAKAKAEFDARPKLTPGQVSQSVRACVRVSVANRFVACAVYLFACFVTGLTSEGEGIAAAADHRSAMGRLETQRRRRRWKPRQRRIRGE